MNRHEFAEVHPNVYLLDVKDTAGLGEYLLRQGWIRADELPIAVENAGEGNMNCALRVRTGHRTVIVKQGRPWVEKYPDIPAPWQRTVVEGEFYQVARSSPKVAGRMPACIGLDRESHVLALENVEGSRDLTFLYSGGEVAALLVDELMSFLGELHRIAVPSGLRAVFHNSQMRALNHEHIFHVPLVVGNGLDLDRITPGLSDAAANLIHDAAYVERVSELGRVYLEEGNTLVHGDYFPGSWLIGPDGVRVIDPEFCFLGRPEFDIGVMLAHLMMAGQPGDVMPAVWRAYEGPFPLERNLALGFAGAEIMRRLIGVAQLPLSPGIETKRRLLNISRDLVLQGEGGE